MKLRFCRVLLWEIRIKELNFFLPKRFLSFSKLTILSAHDRNFSISSWTFKVTLRSRLEISSCATPRAFLANLISSPHLTVKHSSWLSPSTGISSKLNPPLINCSCRNMALCTLILQSCNFSLNCARRVFPPVSFRNLYIASDIWVLFSAKWGKHWAENSRTWSLVKFLCR